MIFSEEFDPSRYDSSDSERDGDDGPVRFRSGGADNALEATFVCGPGGDLSLAVRAFGAALLPGGGSPARCGGRAPANVAALEKDETDFEKTRGADLASASVRATFADGPDVIHARLVLFKHRDYWIVEDTLSVEAPGDDALELGVAFPFPCPIEQPDPASLRVIVPADAGRARLAVFPMPSPGLTASVDIYGDESALLLQQPVREEAHFLTLLHPVAPGEQPQIRGVEGLEAEGALAMRVFFHDDWIHTFVDAGPHEDTLFLNWLPIHSEISLLEIDPAGELSRRIELGAAVGPVGP